ncbi:tyrosine-type recombinase/integrase [Rothia nasimurium]|nr:tyrosine-type recombinase/integrase [Rothia nasimurium]
MNGNNYRKRLRKMLAGTELDWVTPHTARSTVATIVAESMGVSTAASLLGHASEDVTIRNYIVQQKVAPNASAVLDVLG